MLVISRTEEQPDVIVLFKRLLNWRHYIVVASCNRHKSFKYVKIDLESSIPNSGLDLMDDRGAQTS